jgi:4-carboxymuconolactone decarboxylase
MARLRDINEREALPERERWVYDDMLRTRGKILPGYAPLLHCAELVGRVVNVGSYFRFDASLPARTLEVVALTVSTELDDRYEQAVHRRGAANAGVSAAVVDAISGGRALPNPDADESLVAECARELIGRRALSEASFAALRSRFGERGVVELIGAIGFYAMLAYMHNAVQVEASPDAAPPASR